MKTLAFILLSTVFVLHSCIDIKQNLEIPFTSLSFGSDEETQEFYLNSSMSLSVTNSPDWITITKLKTEGEKQTFNAMIKPNPSTTYRSSTITIESTKRKSSQKVTFNVYQEGKSE